MTRRERRAREALVELETDYVTHRSALERDLKDAQAAASAVREGLLYGTGKQLVHAVRSVLESADVAVVDLDEKLGGTKNADLLCTYGGRSRLLEVKSASASAPERADQDLLRHLREWSHLPDSVPVEGGALVLNHELRTVPLERSPRPYGLPEFLAAQTEPVISTLELFAAWRAEDGTPSADCCSVPRLLRLCRLWVRARPPPPRSRPRPTLVGGAGSSGANTSSNTTWNFAETD